jgi:uncharacterized protein
MGLVRLLAIIFVIWLVVYIARRFLQNRATEKKHSQTRQIGNMVRCETCGLHIPDTEAIKANGHYYCCEEHRKTS